MAKPNLDDSGGFQGLLHTLVEDRVEKTLASLIVSHRNATLSPQDALSGIAMMAALRSLPSDLATRIKQAH
jgi:hypothetical protein